MTAPPPILLRASGLITQQDHLRAQFLHLRPRPIYAVLGAILGLLWFAVLLVSFVRPRRSSSMTQFILMLGPAYLVAFFGLWIPWRTRKSFRQTTALQIPVNLFIRDDGILHTHERGEVLVPWAGYIKWREGREHFLLYHTDSMFVVFPKRYFAAANDVRAFGDMLRSKIGRAA